MARPKPGDALNTADGEPATGRLTLKLPKGTALGFDAAVTEVADAIHDQLPEAERDLVEHREVTVQPTGGSTTTTPRRTSDATRMGHLDRPVTTATPR